MTEARGWRDPREGLQTKKYRQTLEAEKDKKTNYPLESPEECHPANAFESSDLQNCERTRLCCLKTLSDDWL